MAQKKRKVEEKKEPQYEFVPPDFDEKDFLEKDIRATKITLLSFLWGIIFGVAAGLTNSISPLVGLLLLFVGIYLLKYFYQLFKIDVKEIDKKGWLGNIVMFSFLFLGTWILILNPPFA
ncbi:MAG TPA: hypothetical protein VGK23_07365 [Methanomassiliicoccales archaeon]|jgi:hypothetical protein